MLSKYIIYLGLIFINISFAQIVHPPKLSFEQFEWGFSINQVQNIIGNKHLKDISTDDNPYFKKDSKSMYLMYFDTVYSEIIGVGLGFLKTNGLLNSISVIYLGVNPETKQQFSNIEDRLDKLSKNITNHYGEPQTEKNVPLVGKISQWSNSTTSIQLLIMTGFAKMLSINYNQISDKSSP